MTTPVPSTRRVAVPPIVDGPPPPSRGRIHHLSGETMGTTWAVTLITASDADIDALRRGITRELDAVVDQMSTWLESSDLSRFNRASAGSVHALPEPFFTVLAYALSVARETDGAYDPTVGPLVNVWGFGPSERRHEPPSPAAIAAARDRVGWRRVTLDAHHRHVTQPGGLYVDLSAIAKGFAVDEVAAFLQRSGFESFLVDIGGELRGAGVKPDGQPWWVALERPPLHRAAPANAASRAEERSADEIIVALHGLAIATSGDYRRYFEHAGRRYAHTIDPRTGHPVTHDVASVTVLHRDCLAADAWSTALTVLGVDEGAAVAAKHDLAALFVRRTPQGFEEHMTPAFEAMLA